MEKVKLTKAQVDAINKALSHYGDAEYLVDIHRKMMNQGHEWSIWTALNDVTPNELHNALHYGYEVDKQSSPQPWKHVYSNVVDLPKAYSHPQCRHTIKKFQTSTQQELEADLDYELTSLHYAMQQGDQAEVERSKKRLAEIHEELGLQPVLEGF